MAIAPLNAIVHASLGSTSSNASQILGNHGVPGVDQAVDCGVPGIAS